MPRLVERALERGIQIYRQSSVTGLTSLAQAPGSEQCATLLDHQSQASWTLAIDALVVCIGRKPALPYLPPQVSTEDVDLWGRTVLPGLYLIGDVRRGAYRQVAIAAGDGVAAAMHAAHYLKCMDWRE
jgi:thioredoxin reductase